MTKRFLSIVSAMFDVFNIQVCNHLSFKKHI